MYLPLSLIYLDFVVDQTQAVKFALDIACGMAFLHTLEPMIPRHYLNSKSVMVRNGKETFPTNLGFYSCGFFPGLFLSIMQENIKYSCRLCSRFVSTNVHHSMLTSDCKM